MTTPEQNEPSTCAVSCSLPSEELTARLAELMNGLLAQVIVVTELPDGYAMDFADTEKRREEIDDFIAFEKQCCSFMTYDVTKTGPQRLRLSLTGPDGTKDFLSKLSNDIVPLEGHDGEDRSGALLKRAGIAGTMAAVFGVVCCATPALAAVMAVLGLAGATGTVAVAIDTAAPLLLATSVALLVMGRRRQRKAAESAGNSGSCEC